MKDFKTMKPREIEAHLRQVILKALGDKIENESTVTSSHGYFSIQIALPTKRLITFDNFRRVEIPSIVRAIKVLGEIFS